MPQPGDAKVDKHGTLGRNNDIGWFKVPVYNRGIDTLVQFANGHAKLQEKIFYCCRKHVAPHDVFCKGWTLNVLHHNRATLGPSQTLDNSGHAPDKQARLLSSLQDLVYVGTIRLPWIHLADKTLGRPHASTV